MKLNKILFIFSPPLGQKFPQKNLRQIYFGQVDWQMLSLLIWACQGVNFGKF